MLVVRRLARSLLAVAALTLAAPALAGEEPVSIARKDGVGSYLQDGRGMTLYTFKKDSQGKSACEGPCLEKWPAFSAERPMPKDGLKASDFGTLTRADGLKQVTYKGLPLYHFAGDKAAGDTAGHGVKDVWSAAAP